jgi:nicotinamidase-related amidase
MAIWETPDMSTFPERSARALLVIDVQAGVVADAYRRDEVVQNICSLVDAARADKVPVVWIQHNEPEMPIDGDDWQLVPELQPQPGEPRVNKKYRSSFEETALEEVLAGLGVGALVICGAQTNNCVRHTLHSALERGYDVTLVEDAHTTSDSDWDTGPILAALTIDEQNRSCLGYDLPGRRCDLTTTAQAFA